MISSFGIVKNNAATNAPIQKPMKNHCGTFSGLSSATKGEKMLAALQNTLQIPIVVAAILTGKNV